MPESKSEYSHLKVPQSNFYSPSLYGQDVEAFHQGNSRELMHRYVKTMKISRYVLISVFILIYIIGGFNLGYYLSNDLLNYAVSHLSFMEELYDKILMFGGGYIVFLNVMVILLFVIPACVVFGIYISLQEMSFLTKFNFSGFMSTVQTNGWRILASVLGSILFISIIYIVYSSVGNPNSSGRLSFIWKPADGLAGYTIYGASAYCAIRGIPAFITSFYILILKVKGDIK